MNVTLVYPSIRNFGGFNSLGKTPETCWINHGVTSLAAVLQQRGYKVRLLDLRDMRGWKDVESFIKSDGALHYGVHVPTLDFHEAVKVAIAIRVLKPSAKIYAGGPHTSICPEQVADIPYFDKIFVGEGEVTFPDALEHPDKYDRVVQCVHPDLNNLPYENREVFNLKKIFNAKSPYNGKPFFPAPFINVMSGRGCVWRCGFCKPGEDKVFGKFRMRSIDHFMGEIEQLNSKYRFKTLMIDDDSFTLNPDYVAEFCNRYEAIGTSFFCQSRADFICRHPDIIKRLKQVGLDTLFIGFESGSQRMLDFMQKDTTVEQNLEAASICHRLGVKIWANVMVGLPTESRAEMMQTFEMVRKINPERPSWAIFTPIVGTHLYDYCKEHDLMLSNDPAVLGSRNPSVPKIKDVDYTWVRGQMYPHSNRGLVRRVAKKAIRTVRPLIHF